MSNVGVIKWRGFIGGGLLTLGRLKRLLAGF